jgi:hypothetical protein
MNDPEVGLDKQVLCGAGAPPANLPGVIPSAAAFQAERGISRAAYKTQTGITVEGHGFSRVPQVSPFLRDLGIVLTPRRMICTAFDDAGDSQFITFSCAIPGLAKAARPEAPAIN